MIDWRETLTVRADRGNKAEPLLVENTLHVLRQLDLCFIFHKPNSFLSRMMNGFPSVSQFSIYVTILHYTGEMD
jgi:hypothetical protein